MACFLLFQLNINLTEDEIIKIFDEVNTNRTKIEDGEQVIDEHEFIEFYHNLLEREELFEIFKKYSKKYEGTRRVEYVRLSILGLQRE